MTNSRGAFVARCLRLRLLAIAGAFFRCARWIDQPFAFRSSSPIAARPFGRLIDFGASRLRRLRRGGSRESACPGSTGDKRPVKPASAPHLARNQIPAAPWRRFAAADPASACAGHRSASEGTRRDGPGGEKCDARISRTRTAEESSSDSEKPQAQASCRTRTNAFRSPAPLERSGVAAQPSVASCELKTLHTNRKRRSAAR